MSVTLGERVGKLQERLYVLDRQLEGEELSNGQKAKAQREAAKILTHLGQLHASCPSAQTATRVNGTRGPKSGRKVSMPIKSQLAPANKDLAQIEKSIQALAVKSQNSYREFGAAERRDPDEPGAKAKFAQALEEYIVDSLLYLGVISQTDSATVSLDQFNGRVGELKGEARKISRYLCNRLKSGAMNDDYRSRIRDLQRGIEVAGVFNKFVDSFVQGSTVLTQAEAQTKAVEISKIILSLVSRLLTGQILQIPDDLSEQQDLIALVQAAAKHRILDLQQQRMSSQTRSIKAVSLIDKGFALKDKIDAINAKLQQKDQTLSLQDEETIAAIQEEYHCVQNCDYSIADTAQQEEADSCIGEMRTLLDREMILLSRDLQRKGYPAIVLTIIAIPLCDLSLDSPGQLFEADDISSSTNIVVSSRFVREPIKLPIVEQII